MAAPVAEDLEEAPVGAVSAEAALEADLAEDLAVVGMEALEVREDRVFTGALVGALVHVIMAAEVALADVLAP